MSTVRANNYYDASGGSNAQLYGVASPAASMGFRNRLINGWALIDQRNAGAAVTLTAANFVYPVDRFYAFRTAGTTGATAQQVNGSITGGKAIRIQRTAGNTATDTLGFGQVIESANCAGLAGNSVTLSFRARCGANFSAASSQITARIGTGTGTDQSTANFYNNAWTGQSNTNTAITLTTSWQPFTSTITAGASVNQVGIQFYWTPSGTAGADDWVEIELIQLEAGTVASPFERRDYGRELIMCQRYFLLYSGVSGTAGSGSTMYTVFQLPVTMRSAPTASTTAVLTMTYPGVANYTQSSPNVAAAAPASTTSAFLQFGNFSGFTIGNPIMMNGNSQVVQLSAEL